MPRMWNHATYSRYFISCLQKSHSNIARNVGAGSKILSFRNLRPFHDSSFVWTWIEFEFEAEVGRKRTIGGILLPECRLCARASYRCSAFFVRKYRKRPLEVGQTSEELIWLDILARLRRDREIFPKSHSQEGFPRERVGGNSSENLSRIFRSIWR